MKILQRSKGPKHQDSFWYDGPIAKTERFTLVATGDIRVTFASVESPLSNRPPTRLSTVTRRPAEKPAGAG